MNHSGTRGSMPDPLTSDRCVVIEGNFTDGFEIIGPFDDFDAACEYNPEGRPTWIATLTSAEQAELDRQSRIDARMRAIYSNPTTPKENA